MILYKRNIRTSLFLLRASLIVIISIGILSYVKDVKTIGFLAILAFLLSSFITITSVTIYKDSLEIIPGLTINDDLLKIKRFYFFGLVPVQWHISKDQVEEQMEILKRFEAEEILYTDTLLDVILEWFPRPSNFQGVIFKYKISNGDFRYVKVNLTQSEYLMVVGRFKNESTQSMI